MNLPPLCEAFVLHFGEMGSRWGVNRTVGQIYAVLFIAETALCADDLVDRLGISRSNVSMGLKELHVRRQNIRHRSRRRLAECGPRPRVDVRRRVCGEASADVRWSAA